MPNVSAKPGEAGEGDGLLTVAEAAARVGLTERTLAQILQTDTFAGRTVAEDRQTEAGPRTVTLVPPPLMADLLSYYETGKAAVSEDGRDAGSGSGAAGKGDGVTAPPPDGPEAASLAAQIASARETILRAEEARARAEREQAHAEAALERALRGRDTETERLNAALRRAQDALTQALTALTQEQQRTLRLETTQATLIQYAPAPPAPQASPAVPDHSAVSAPDRETPATTETPADTGADGGHPGFWGRLWLLLAD